MGSTTTAPAKRRPGLSRLLQSKDPERRDPGEYQEFVKSHYDGLYGWLTLIMGYLNGHESLAGRLFDSDAFDLRGCKTILDAGCGNGRYLRVMLRRADADALLVGFDLSQGMLRRARNRLKSNRPHLLAANLTRLPYRDASFDAVVCGWVIEHLPDPAAGLREIARVLKPSGKVLLLTTEDSLLGAISSRFYHSRMFRRSELRTLCEQNQLVWHREIWWSRLHQWFGRGGIVVELRRSAPAAAATNGVAACTAKHC